MFTAWFYFAGALLWLFQEMLKFGGIKTSADTTPQQNKDSTLNNLTGNVLITLKKGWLKESPTPPATNIIIGLPPYIKPFLNQF